MTLSTVCPKVRVNFEAPSICPICWPILKPFGMLNPHINWFCLVYDKACHVLPTTLEHTITFEEMLKEQKEVKILTFLVFKDCLWTLGQNEVWEKFDSQPPGAVPLITGWHERGRMKRNWLLTPVRQSQLQPTAKHRWFLFILPSSCQAVINGTAPGDRE